MLSRQKYPGLFQLFQSLLQRKFHYNMDLDAFNLGEVQVRRVYPDIFDACSATCERENLNSIINLNFMIFPAKNFALNSNFAAHRWCCNHIQHIDRLDVVVLALDNSQLKTRLTQNKTFML